MRKIYIVGGNGYKDYVNWILPLGFEITNDRLLADVVFWAGGEDLYPGYYNQSPGSYVSYNIKRDQFEKQEFDFFKEKFKIGVCRGSQFGAVMGTNGKAKIVQHMRHPWEHELSTNTGEKIISPSGHHNQMLFDEKITGLQEGVDYELIGWTTKLSPYHLGENDKDYNFPVDYKEPEIAWIPESKFWLCQSHPEGRFPPESNDDLKYINFCQNSLKEKMIQCGIFNN